MYVILVSFCLIKIILYPVYICICMCACVCMMCMCVCGGGGGGEPRRVCVTFRLVLFQMCVCRFFLRTGFRKNYANFFFCEIVSGSLLVT